MLELRDQLVQWASFLGPNIYLQASAAVLIFVLGGKIAEVFLAKVFGKIVSRSNSKFDDQFVTMLQRPIYVTFTLIGLAIATRILDLSETPTFITLGIIRTVAIAIWYNFFRAAFSLILQVISRSKRSSKVFDSMVPLIETVARVVLIAMSIYFIFLAWDIDVTAWLASAGIIGLALGFAARDTLSNLFAGVSIAADAPYKKGDYIILESGERGMVSQIGLRSTRLLTRDDVEITVPNGMIGNGKIINEAGGPSSRHRIRVAVGVAYRSDIDQVIAALNAVAVENEEVCSTPEPRVRFRNFGDSSLDFELLCWIEQPVDRGRLLHELHCAVYKRFEKEGIQIPFPQRELHVRTMPDGSD